MKKATIVGAGLVGSLLSIFLSRKGYKVTIFERRPDMRKGVAGAGRSINLALSDRGWKALKSVGIEKEISEVAIPMYGRAIHKQDGSSSFLAYGKDKQAIYSVSRGGLNSTLMDIAERYGVEILFNERCEGIDLREGNLRLKNFVTREESHHQSDHIFSTDGAFSAARHELEMTDRYNYSQYYLEHGYKELTIPAVQGEWALEKNVLHIWPRENYMLIALPNLDGSFTCTLFFPFEGESSFEALKTESEIHAFFNRVFPDVVPLMPSLVEDYLRNPVSSLITIKCFPWSYKDKVLLLGDAAHAIVPFFGQGMNCGFEDCTVLNDLLESHRDDITKVFRDFERVRKPNTDAIAELAMQNFIEMRDLVADPKFLLRKKIEGYINGKYPDKWIPLYSMVTFSDIPYAEALKAGKRQDEIMEKIMQLENIEKEWDTPQVNEILESMLESEPSFNI